MHYFSMQVSIIPHSELGSQRVLNHLARSVSLQTGATRKSYTSEEIMDALERLQCTNLRVGGPGFGRGKPKLCLTPFRDHGMTFGSEPAQRENDLYELKDLMRRWSGNGQILWSKQPCDENGFVFCPRHEAPNAHPSALKPLDILVPRRVCRPNRVPLQRGRGGRVQKNPAPRRLRRNQPVVELHQSFVVNEYPRQSDLGTPLPGRFVWVPDPEI